MARAAALSALLIVSSAVRAAHAEPMAPEIVPFDDAPVVETVAVEAEPSVPSAAFEDVSLGADHVPAADQFRLDDIVNPYVGYVGYQVAVVDQFVNPYRDDGYRAEAASATYAELCRRYCQDSPRPAPAPAAKYDLRATPSRSRDRLIEDRRSNADLRMLGGFVLAGTLLGALAFVAGDPSFENEAGLVGTGVLVGGGLVVGLALVTTGDKVELRFARNQVARAR
jgi:hypothetical protein